MLHPTIGFSSFPPGSETVLYHGKFTALHLLLPHVVFVPSEPPCPLFLSKRNKYEMAVTDIH